MIHNMVGGGGKTGAILTVSGDAGATVTVTKDSKTYTHAINSDGIAVFKGLETGTWSLTMSKDGDAPVTDDVEITSDYSHSMTFFRSYINVTYPVGSTLTCTHTDGTVYTADTDTGSYTFVIKKPGTWTILSTNNIQSDSGSIEITASGQNENFTLKYFAAYINVTAPSGSTLTCVNGDDSQVYTLGSSETAHTFTVLGTGTYTITGIRGAESDSKTVEIAIDGQSESVTIQYFVAYIKVTVKGAAGSTELSCSDGTNAYNYTLSTNGDYQFTVYNEGAWTITGVRSNQTQSTTADVNTNGQIVNVALVYELALFDNGSYASETGGWTGISGNNLYIRRTCNVTGGDSYGAFYTNNKVDLTEYSTLHFTIVGKTGDEDYDYPIGASANTGTGLTNFAASKKIYNSAVGTTVTVDISSLSTSYYIRGVVYCIGNGTYGSLTISKVWLS